LGIGRQGSPIQPADFLAGDRQVRLFAARVALFGYAAFGFRGVRSRGRRLRVDLGAALFAFEAGNLIA
jgi:hypothetical protein